MVFTKPTYPMKRAIRCTCERFVDESGADVQWSLCQWHEDKTQWAARETHRHDPTVCRQCAARPADTTLREAIEQYRQIGSRVGGDSIDPSKHPAVNDYAYRLSDQMARIWLGVEPALAAQPTSAEDER